MERFFADLIAVRLLLGRVLANQAHASGDPEAFFSEQLAQAKKDLTLVKIGTEDPQQAEAIQSLAELSIEDIFDRIHFSS